MREPTLLRLFEFVVKYPFYIVAVIGFAVMHHRFANRFGCYGLFRNLLYIAACMVVATALFFMGVLLIRHTGMSPLLSSQLVVGFAFSGVVVAAGRIFFRTKPQTPKITS